MTSLSTPRATAIGSSTASQGLSYAPAGGGGGGVPTERPISAQRIQQQAAAIAAAASYNQSNAYSSSSYSANPQYQPSPALYIPASSSSVAPTVERTSTSGFYSSSQLPNSVAAYNSMMATAGGNLHTSAPSGSTPAGTFTLQQQPQYPSSTVGVVPASYATSSLYSSSYQAAEQRATAAMQQSQQQIDEARQALLALQQNRISVEQQHQRMLQEQQVQKQQSDQQHQQLLLQQQQQQQLAMQRLQQQRLEQQQQQQQLASRSTGTGVSPDPNGAASGGSSYHSVGSTSGGSGGYTSALSSASLSASLGGHQQAGGPGPGAGAGGGSRSSSFTAVASPLVRCREYLEGVTQSIVALVAVSSLCERAYMMSNKASRVTIH